MINKTVNENPFVRLLFGLGKGCLIGVLGGIIFGVIGSCIFWVLSKIFYQGLHIYTINLIEFINQEVEITGIPLGLIIGVTTGLHHVVFNTFNPKSFVWAAVACLGTVLGLWLSHLTNLDPDFIIRVAFYIEVGCIGLMTGWIAHKVTTIKPDGVKNMVRREFIFLSFISGLLLIFVATYYYFTLMNYLRNIPS
jgi:hypothetical protein